MGEKGFSKHVFTNWYQKRTEVKTMWVGGGKLLDTRGKCSQIRMETRIEMCVCGTRAHTVFIYHQHYINVQGSNMCLLYKPTNGYRANFLSSKKMPTRSCYEIYHIFGEKLVVLEPRLT